MFPPQIAHVFIEWLTSPGDCVYDPFSGRGTVPLEAVLAGRVGYGSDANPLAALLTSAKVRIPAAGAVEARLTVLEKSFHRTGSLRSHIPPQIRMLYAPRVLEQLDFLKSNLSTDSSIDRFIIAMILGMLHANHSTNGATRGFSISMPNTFAMAPGYVRAYIRKHRLTRPDVDVFEMLRNRAQRLELPDHYVQGGRGWRQDATHVAPAWLLANKPKLIFTSPPYLETIKYGKFNWVRLWFLGHSSKNVDCSLMASSSVYRYLTFLERVLKKLRPCIASNGYVCLVIGDVRRGEKQLNLAKKVWLEAAEPQGWHLHGIVADQLPTGHKVSRIWKTNPGRATTVDRVLILGASRRHRLPCLDPLVWDEYPQFCDYQQESANDNHR